MTDSRLIIEAADILDEDIRDKVKDGAKSAYTTIRHNIRKIIENLKYLYSKILVKLANSLSAIKLNSVKKNINKYDENKRDKMAKAFITAIGRQFKWYV